MADCATCPVCVFHATNVPAEDLLASGWRCDNCGRMLGDHRHFATEAVAAGQAFAIDPDAITYEVVT